MYLTISSSVFNAEPSGPQGEMINPFQAFAVTNRLMSLTACIIVWMSYEAVKNPRSIVGGSNGSVLFNVTFPPNNRGVVKEGRC